MENPGQPDIDTVREMLRQRDEQVIDEDEGADVAEVDEDPAKDPDARD